MNRFGDRVLLVGSAILVVFMAGAAFVAADAFHISAAWVFLAWNSVFIMAVFLKDFRSHLENYWFLAYLATWAMIHGALVVLLMRLLPFSLCVAGMGVELTLGYFFADILFNIRPEETGRNLSD